MLNSKCARALGYAIIAGSLLFKLPEIRTLLKVKSSEGRSVFSAVCDVVAVLIALAYNFAQPGQVSCRHLCNFTPPPREPRA